MDFTQFFSIITILVGVSTIFIHITVWRKMGEVIVAINDLANQLRRLEKD